MIRIHYYDNGELLNRERYEAYTARMRPVLEAKHTGEYRGQLGWLDVQRWGGPEMRSQIQAVADRVRGMADVFAVVGLGGSNQGARAVIDALSWRGDKGPEIIYPALFLSAAEYRRLVKSTRGRSLVIDVIAKNFKTLEPGVCFRLLRDEMEARYGLEGMKERIVVTPTPGLDALDEIAGQQGYVTLPFPEDVGGRYSVFTPVGLLPIAVAGGSIDELIRGATDAQADFAIRGPLSRQVREYALRRNYLYEQGFDVEAAVFFEPCLNALGMWWRQLFGESEGKNGRGIFPTVMVDTEALHSLGQYMQSGKRHVSETFFHVCQPLDDLPVSGGCGFPDRFDYLEGKTLNDLNLAAYNATVKVHSQGGVPCHVVELDRMDEYHLGMCMYAMMRACYESSLLLGVNPFDQPGVEAYKTEMFRILK
ncbi:MAG: glucose-6-phosphate isomerase [Aristaeellaceae bacterium]